MNYRGTGAVLPSSTTRPRMVVSLAMLLTRQQDPVGLVLFDEKANTILPPSATQSQILVMSSLLEKCQPARKTELGGLLLSLADQFRRRNLVVIVSDLFTDLDKLYDALNRLRFQRARGPGHAGARPRRARAPVRGPDASSTTSRARKSCSPSPGHFAGRIRKR